MKMEKLLLKIVEFFRTKKGCDSKEICNFIALNGEAENDVPKPTI